MYYALKEIKPLCPKLKEPNGKVKLLKSDYINLNKKE